MAIQTEINRLTSARNTIRSKFVEFGVSNATDNLTKMAEDISKSSLSNTADATVTALNLGKGITAYGAGGKITGTAPWALDSVENGVPVYDITSALEGDGIRFTADGVGDKLLKLEKNVLLPFEATNFIGDGYEPSIAAGKVNGKTRILFDTGFDELYYSDDFGKTITRVSTSAVNALYGNINNKRKTIAYGNGVFMVVADAEGDAAGVYVSPDCVTWTFHTTKNTFDSSGIVHLCYSIGAFHLISTDKDPDNYSGSTFYSYISTDNGATWADKKTVYTSGWNYGYYLNQGHFGIAAGDGEVMVVSCDDDGGAYASIIKNDGSRSLTHGKLPGGGGYPVDVAYGDGKYIVTGQSSGYSMMYDGSAWTKITMPAAGLSYIVYGEYDGKKLWIAHNNSLAALSEDGVTWTTEMINTSGTYTRNEFVCEGFALMGKNGAVIISRYGDQLVIEEV